MSNETEKRLNAYHELTKTIQLKQSYLAELKDRRGLKASIASEVHTNTHNSIDEKITNDIVDIEKEIKKLEADAVEAYEDVINLINSVDNDLYKKILYARFINFKSFGEIANDICYSYTHARLLCHEAILEINSDDSYK